jgi:hypothetical protein
MTTPLAEPLPRAPRLLRSTGAVIAGVIVIVGLSMCTDKLLEATGVFPPGQPMGATRLFLLAILYRDIYAVLGGYVTARLAPHTPVRHAVILGIVGVIANAGGEMATINKPELGPTWYPIALMVTAVPFCWLGGVLYRARGQGAA